ncbi:MAG: hypothetical protein AVDCRST_MAG57-2651 [uncultured Blastococcus sp.]|uniref:Uncharacterized protein n=1 Tax=uncultured Blastococcus sp. TaxID=217144 RepID=A0A6J4ITM3_9ACTN|nr:MAG: hypothetical protein AVDCRST_MAG57-2651 [uncultured Blastococcus sp.]
MKETSSSPWHNGRGSDIQPEGHAMYMLEHDLARSRMSEMQAEAEAASRARRLYVARRAARRAERAVRRAARASAAVY